ncbi:MAG: hypothetical protein AM1032_000168 [Mycoplasmataceae bacterium]|nr:MAG: hypothetical protein AM1032_000168 [Mycoplasmataceae bacterium]
MNDIIKLKKLEENNEIIKNFITNCDVKILNFKVSINKIIKKKCCLDLINIIVYQKKNGELGRIRYCCDKKLQKETNRTYKQINKPKRTKDEIYLSSYNSIRGRIGKIIFQALLGANERKYIRESEIIKNESILRSVHYWLESCTSEEWDQAISNFQNNPTKEKIEEIIYLYSPLYKENWELIKKMAIEIFSYLDNFPQEWKEEEIRIISTHLGMSNIVIGNKLMDFKFTNKKIGVQKNYFEKLYRYWKSSWKINPEEKFKIKEFCIFSPINKEKIEISIEEAVKKWNLEEDFQVNFSLWQLNNYISISKTKKDLPIGIMNWENNLKINEIN